MFSRLRDWFSASCAPKESEGVLILSEHDVTIMMSMRECVDIMEDTLTSLSRGDFHNPLRHVVLGPGAAGRIVTMPAYRAGARPYYALKEICVFPGNAARGLDSHQGAVLLHCGETGRLLAIMNASAITAMRTAAASAVATNALARKDSKTLAILGAGVQARAHLASLSLVRDLKEIRIATRTRAKAEELARLDRRVRVVDTVEEAVRGADIIAATTSSHSPVVNRAWISPGTHINAVGAPLPMARELDGATVAASSMFVDRRESAVHESGDYLLALKEGAIGAGHIRGEVGEVLLGRIPGRTSAGEITLFKSLGIAAEDLAVAAFLYERAQRAKSGTYVKL